MEADLAVLSWAAPDGVEGSWSWSWSAVEECCGAGSVVVDVFGADTFFDASTKLNQNL